MFVTGFLLVLFQLQNPISKFTRAVVASVCAGCVARYLYWRILFGLPQHQNPLQRVWAVAFLVMEVAALTSGAFVYFFMSRHIDRSAVADATRDSVLHTAPVDVFIPTYNEAPEILERTVVGAKAIDHPDLRVWILDDGARPWVEDLARELGALYACRVHGKHAKAGNVNNGLSLALTRGRKPAFLLLLDADFVPSRHILKRTLGLFEEDDVGIVQTPQHFFNPDPVQSNLLVSAAWPDEQRFFFNSHMPCKDAWGAAFCCGTSAVLRVRALEACGGMGTETVTEDMLTSFKMLEHGYRTIYLNERLSMGLAAESLQEFLTQRSRWCLGTIQQIYTRWSFFGRARVNLINRISLLDGVLYWLTSSTFRLMLTIAPILYWLTGTSVVRATPREIVYWLGPMAVSNLIFMHFVAKNRVLPVVSDISGLLTSFVITRTVAVSLVRQFGHAFKVTAKGISSSGVVVQWGLLWRYAALAGLTALGVLSHAGKFSPGHGIQGYSLNIFWSVINVGILSLACLACVELPKRRRDQRFVTAEEGWVQMADGSGFGCRLQDISLSGACLEREQGWAGMSGPAELVVDGGGYGDLAIPIEVVRSGGRRLGVRFESDTRLRRRLIVKLFTGAYNQDVEHISALGVFGKLVRAFAS